MGSLITLDNTHETAIDLTDALKKAEQQIKSFNWEKNTKILSIRNLQEFFEKLILKFALKKGYIISVDFYSGVMYVANVLQEFAHKNPKYWYAIDYINEGLKSNNPETFKTGGDTCFFICTILPAWTERNAMHYEDYAHFGINFYKSYYNMTKRPIGSYMSSNFPGLAECTFEGIQWLQQV